MAKPKTATNLSKATDHNDKLTDPEHFQKAYVKPLVTAGWLERAIPDKPTGRLQKYRFEGKRPCVARRRDERREVPCFTYQLTQATDVHRSHIHH